MTVVQSPIRPLIDAIQVRISDLELLEEETTRHIADVRTQLRRALERQGRIGEELQALRDALKFTWRAERIADGEEEAS